LEVETLRMHKGAWKMGAKAFVESKVAAEGMIVARAGSK
jgi:hypothetical protein